MALLMSILNNIPNIVSGNFRHWNRTNWIVAQEILARLEHLKKENKNYYKEFRILGLFFSLQHSLFKNIFLDGFLRPQLKKMDKEKFLKINITMLCFSCSCFIAGNPKYKEKLAPCLIALFEEKRDLVLRMMTEIEFNDNSDPGVSLSMSLISIIYGGNPLNNFDYDNWMSLYYRWVENYPIAIDILKKDFVS